MYYSFQINGDENRMGGGESSINSVERREGGKGRKREEEGTLGPERRGLAQGHAAS